MVQTAGEWRRPLPRLAFIVSWIRNTIRNVTMVVPELITNGQFSENSTADRPQPKRARWAARCRTRSAIRPSCTRPNVDNDLDS